MTGSLGFRSGRCPRPRSTTTQNQERACQSPRKDVKAGLFALDWSWSCVLMFSVGHMSSASTPPAVAPVNSATSGRLDLLRLICLSTHVHNSLSHAITAEPRHQLPPHAPPSIHSYALDPRRPVPESSWIHDVTLHEVYRPSRLWSSGSASLLLNVAVSALLRLLAPPPPPLPASSTHPNQFSQSPLVFVPPSSSFRFNKQKQDEHPLRR